MRRHVSEAPHQRERNLGTLQHPHLGQMEEEEQITQNFSSHRRGFLTTGFAHMIPSTQPPIDMGNSFGACLQSHLQTSPPTHQ